MWFYEERRYIDSKSKQRMMERVVEEARKRIGPSLKRVLLLPPDITRYHSGAGLLTNMLYHILASTCHVDVIPTLGQHVPHSMNENSWMFGDIPQRNIHVHNWKASCVSLGKVSEEYVRYASDNRVDWEIPVEINRAVVEGKYDLVINIGQVVPHEVLGFANHNKNYFIGLGSKSTICASHMTSALCGIEDNLGQIITPLRACYNWAERELLKDVPDVYVLIVNTQNKDGELFTSGLYVGEDIYTYIKASQYARERIIHTFDRPLRKVVCMMDKREFKSTWVANKAIYRTRKVIADGGELVVIAPGVQRFGEQEEVDRIIRKYGYRGTSRTLDAFKSDPELHELGHAAAHLIHGSSEDRFTITYAPGRLTEEEIQNVGYNYLDLQTAMKTFKPMILKDGLNVVNGEEIYFISSPSLGLWTAKNKFIDSLNNNRKFAQRMHAKEPKETIWQQITQLDKEDVQKYSSLDYESY